MSFYQFHTGARLNNLPLDNVMGLKFQKWKCACGSSFIKIVWKLLSLKMSITLRERSSGSTFCRNYQGTKGCSCEELVEVIVFTFDTFVQLALYH